MRIDVKRWITKYWATRGILRVTGQLSHPYFYVYDSLAGESFVGIQVLKGWYHKTLTEAKVHAERLRDREIVRLKARIERLKKLEF